MHLLNTGAAVRRNADLHILRTQQSGELSAIIPGKRNDSHIACYRRFYGLNDVAGVATG